MKIELKHIARKVIKSIALALATVIVICMIIAIIGYMIYYHPIVSACIFFAAVIVGIANSIYDSLD